MQALLLRSPKAIYSWLATFFYQTPAQTYENRHLGLVRTYRTQAFSNS